MTSQAGTTPSNAQSRPYLPGLDALRILAVLWVVGIHVTGETVQEGALGWAGYALRVTIAACVPLFVMMTGALNLSPGAHRHGPRTFLIRRARRIVPALVVWSTVYLLFSTLTADVELNLATVVDQILTGETYVHLYFLWLIAGVYLLAPVVQPFLGAGDEPRRAWILGISAMLWTALVIAAPLLTRAFNPERERVLVVEGSLTYGLLFLGYFLVGRAIMLSPPSRRIAVALLAGCIPLIAVMTILEAKNADHPLLSIWRVSYTAPLLMAYSVMFFAAWVSLTSSWRMEGAWAHRLRTLAEATFGVFLVHFLVMIPLREAVPYLAQPEALPLLLLWFLTVIISAVISLLAAKVPGLRLIF